MDTEMKTTRQTAGKFMARAFFGAVLMVLSIAWVDSKGWFDAPPDPNPHIEKRWSALKALSEAGHNVDVLVLGNSHAYTGINPKHLSAELGMTAMVLANNSMNWTDSYWTLQEALLYCTPQVIVIDTYGLDRSAPGHRAMPVLVNQIRAFKARKAFGLKIRSALDLFTLEELGLGLSATIRNHQFLWESPEIIKENMARGEPRELVRDEDLFLGRFVRFTSGLSAETLARYDSLGPVVDGAKWKVRPENRRAAGDIAGLCAERGMDLVWLTLPMYDRHVTAKEAWFAELESVRQAASPDVPWLNLQADSAMTGNPDFFEDTYSANQHMTRNGSLLAAHKLAQFMEKRRTAKWAERSADSAWHALMAGAEGFYGHQLPMEGADAQVLARDLVFKGLPIDDITRYVDETCPDGNSYLQFRVPEWPKNLPAASEVNLVATWDVELPKVGLVRAPTKLQFAPHLSDDSLKVFRTMLVAGANLKRFEDLSLERVQ